MSEEATIQQADEIISATNAMTVQDAARTALITDLKPIADRLTEYSGYATTLKVNNKSEADAAAEMLARIDADLKVVNDHEVLSKITDGLHKLHRRWTGFRSIFMTQMEDAKKQIRRTITAYNDAMRQAAEAEQRRLQAEAEAKARKERERLEKEAAKLKTPEKQEAKLAQAAAVVTPTIRVEAETTNIRTRKVWKVKAVDLPVFLIAVAKDRTLHGFVTVEMNRLARSKAANPTLEIGGITFEQVTV